MRPRGPRRPAARTPPAANHKTPTRQMAAPGAVPRSREEPAIGHCVVELLAPQEPPQRQDRHYRPEQDRAAGDLDDRVDALSDVPGAPDAQNSPLRAARVGPIPLYDAGVSERHKLRQRE